VTWSAATGGAASGWLAGRGHHHLQGSNLPVAEIEAVIGKREVADVALIGIPDPATDERVCAVITAAEDVPPTLTEVLPA
jgi:acyl-CoA synthetase (AMP-forming)/AMP-acid ligase II